MSEVIITLRKPKKKPRGPQGHRRGVIHSTRGSEILYRRQSKKGFLKFYNMGQIWDPDSSSWLNDDFQITRSAGWVSGNFLPDDPDQTDADAINAHYVGETAGAIASKYRLIEQDHGDYFQLAIYFDEDEAQRERLTSDNPNWKPGGLQISQSRLDSATTIDLMLDIAVDSPELTRAFLRNTLTRTTRIKGTGAGKVTTVYDPDASAVSFDLAEGDEIFIRPQLCNPGFSLERRNPSDIYGGGLRRYSTVNLDDPTELNYIAHISSFGVIGTLADANRIYSLFATYSGRTYGKHDFATNAKTIIDQTEADSIYATIAAAVDGTAPPFDLDVMGFFGSEPGERTIALIIKRGSSLFYVWSN